MTIRKFRIAPLSVKIGHVVACLLALVVVTNLLPQSAAAKTTNSQWRALPWHLVDYFHRLPPTGSFQSIEITTRLDGDVDKGSNLYISPLWGQINKTGFYFGFLSDVYNQRKRISVGKGLIFSRWGKSSKADTRVTDTGWAFVGEKATSGEGDFASIRMPYSWGSGLYSFYLRKAKQSDQSVSEEISQNHMWLELSVLEHRSKQLTKLGALKFYGEKFTLSTRLVSFIEIYADRKKGKNVFPTELPRIDVLFGLPLVNNRYSAVSGRAVYGKNVPKLTLSTIEDSLMKFSLGKIPVPASPARAGQ